MNQRVCVGMSRFDFSRDASGRITILVTCPIQDLPAVRPAELKQAWDTASVAVRQGLRLTDNDPYGLAFKDRSGQSVDLIFHDSDAHLWAVAIHRAFDLSTIKGLSLCLRMLALYQLMAGQSWARCCFKVDKNRPITIENRLLREAALTNLTETGGFDQAALKRQIGVDLATA